MLIFREEKQSDHKEIYDLHVQSFGNQTYEADLVEKIRRSENYIHKLSIVAEINDQIVGHILISKAKIVYDKGSYPTLVLAPIGVKPVYQRQGIGSQLMQRSLEVSKNLGYGAVFLIGHPGYYPRFGFRPAGPLGYELKQFDVPNDVFMVCHLGDLETEANLGGELIYPRTFFDEQNG